MIIPHVILYPLIPPVSITYTSIYLIIVSLMSYVEKMSGWTHPEVRRLLPDPTYALAA